MRYQAPPLPSAPTRSASRATRTTSTRLTPRCSSSTRPPTGPERGRSRCSCTTLPPAYDSTRYLRIAVTRNRGWSWSNRLLLHRSLPGNYAVRLSRARGQSSGQQRRDGLGAVITLNRQGAGVGGDSALFEQCEEHVHIATLVRLQRVREAVV